MAGDAAVACSCGHQFGRGQARLHRPPPPTDHARVKEIRAASRRDLQTAAALIGGVALLNLVLFAMFDARPAILSWIALFWGVISIIRGFRLRREAWELEHLGFIPRERDRSGPT